MRPGGTQLPPPLPRARRRVPPHTDAAAVVARVCLLIGAAASVATLVVLSVVVARAAAFAAEAPELLGGAIMRYVEDEVPDMLDAYVEDKLVPGMQEQMVGWMFGPGAGALAADEAPRPTHTHRRTAPPCPVSDAALCAQFRATCTAFGVCRTTRDRDTCVGFVRSLNAVCAANACDVYYDRGLCDRVTAACNRRMRCVFNQTACVVMEGDVAGLCAAVV